MADISDIDKIKNVIKTKVRPILVMDGGNIEFIGYEDKIVTVKLLGACNGCPLSSITLKNVVKDLIREEVPEIEGVKSLNFDDEYIDPEINIDDN
jgi:Fe-S cluster biogenesis protein NfuA